MLQPDLQCSDNRRAGRSPAKSVVQLQFIFPDQCGEVKTGRSGSASHRDKKPDIDIAIRIWDVGFLASLGTATYSPLVVGNDVRRAGLLTYMVVAGGCEYSIHNT